MQKLLVILGPTATGKTDLALKVAKSLNGEIIACDSRQVYKDLDIGTGKMPSKNLTVEKQKGFWIVDDVKIWLYDIADSKIRYTVSEYINNANYVLNQITSSGKLPIIVGGTGLYLKGLLEGFSNLGIPENPVLREELENLPLEDLQQKLKNLSEEAFAKLNYADSKNKRRLTRSIELNVMYPYINKNQKIEVKSKKFKILKVGLTTFRQELNKLIDLRLDSRLNQGLIDEAQRLHQQGLSLKRMRDLGLEYRYLADYLEGKINIELFKEQLKNKIHQYAKRQMTWFKRDKDIKWFDILDKNYSRKVEKYIRDWYNLS